VTGKTIYRWQLGNPVLGRDYIETERWREARWSRAPAWSRNVLLARLPGSWHPVTIALRAASVYAGLLVKANTTCPRQDCWSMAVLLVRDLLSESPGSRPSRPPSPRPSSLPSTYHSSTIPSEILITAVIEAEELRAQIPEMITDFEDQLTNRRRRWMPQLLPPVRFTNHTFMITHLALWQPYLSCRPSSVSWSSWTHSLPHLTSTLCHDRSPSKWTDPQAPTKQRFVGTSK